MEVRMTIKKRIILAGIVLCIFMLAFSLSILFSFREISRAVDQGRLAYEISRGAAQLNGLARAYATHSLPRLKTQWQERADSLGTLLSDGAWTGSERELIARLRENQASAQRLFPEVSTAIEGWSKALEQVRPLRRESAERLMTQLTAKTQDMEYYAYRLNKVSVDRIAAVQHRTFVIIISLIAALLGLIAVIWNRLYLGIVIPLHKIENTAAQFARGNLTVLAPEEDNEIGRLGRAFNRMGQALNILYENLSKEISERKAAQEQLQKSSQELEKRVEERTLHLNERTRELEETNKELESFSYSVSHDLRAPLRAIDGFSSMLLKELGGKIEEEPRRKLNIVRENTLKMSRLIDDLLNLSRLGRQALNVSTLDMEVIFREAWKELCHPTPERNARLELKELKELKETSGDRALIKQVVLNILSNALKYTRDRNPALIEVGSSFDGDGSIVFRVKDNGAGFDMAYYDKLFGVFQRLHSESEYEGTGVGLAIVQRIIHRHGGRVWAEGEPGKGATFWFSLPAGKD